MRSIAIVPQSIEPPESSSRCWTLREYPGARARKWLFPGTNPRNSKVPSRSTGLGRPQRATGTTRRLSLSEAGVEGDRGSFNPHLSANGAFVVFDSEARNLAGIETNFLTDAFELELATGQLRKLSVHPNGVEGDAVSSAFSVSDDGAIVPMYSDSFDLIGGDANGFFDLLVRDLTVPDPEAACQAVEQRQ